MNHCVPDWNIGDGSRNFPDLLPGSNQKKSMGGPDPELVELLWRNGQVVMNSQTHRKPNPAAHESKQIHKPEQPFKSGVGTFGNASNSIQEDETASWLQYPLDDSLEKFCSDFFYEMPTADSIGAEKLTKATEQETNMFTVSNTIRSQPVFNQSNNLDLADNAMPPPKFQINDSILQHPNSSFSRVANFSHFSRSMRDNLGLNELRREKGSGNVIQGEAGESSMMTINGSHCGSNQVQIEVDLSRVSRNGGGATNIFVGPIKEDVQKISIRSNTGHTDTLEPTVTSSSGGSGGSFGKLGKQTASNQSHKRKGREADESECQSEEADYGSVEASKPSQRSMSARRSRAAEVHNLSERRRRDRINEKMKALQELIPHCNKSDKASMLDEAIEYLKSLQLQVQIMWMGSGMAPMMFPGVQHYISRMGLSMGMGMGNGPLPPIHSPMQFPSVPLVDPSIASVPPQNQQPLCPLPNLNSINFQNQMQNASLPEAYARYLGFHSMQSAPQAMNLFGYGSQAVQQSQKISPPGCSSRPCNGGVSSGNIQNGKMGTIERRPISLEKRNLVLNTL